MHSLLSLAFASISQRIYGLQQNWAKESIRKLSGCVACISSNSSSSISFGLAIRSSMHKHLFFRHTSLYNEWKKGLICLSLDSSLRKTRSSTFFRIASLPVRMASNFLLQIFFCYLSVFDLQLHLKCSWMELCL